MRRFQCTTRGLVTFRFQKIYPEVDVPVGRQRSFTDPDTIFLLDDYDRVSEWSPGWVKARFQELPPIDDILPDLYARPKDMYSHPPRKTYEEEVKRVIALVLSLLLLLYALRAFI